MRLPHFVVTVLVCLGMTLLPAQKKKPPFEENPDSHIEDGVGPGRIIAQPGPPAVSVPPIGELGGVFSHDYPPIPDKGTRCIAQQFALPGAVPGMSGSVAAVPALPLGVNAQQVKVPRLGAVIIELCNDTGAEVNPDPATFSVRLSL